MMIAANIISMTILFAVPLLLVAMGGMFSEHSGVINLGLEGIMVIGALGGALAMRMLTGAVSGAAMVLLVLLAAVVRSEERRVGKEGSFRSRSRWSPYH